MANKKSLKNHDTPPDKEKKSWHPAFFGAIQIELDKHSQYLRFTSEYLLATEPLQIDVVIIKKTKNIEIKKNIASIFKKDNIVEYKSPTDHISIKDFYKVYAYACLYMFLNNTDIDDITLTLVESRYPRKLLEHLRQKRKYTVEEKWPGVYIVSGDVFPIQIINIRGLSAEENIWLRSLYHKLEAPEIQRIMDEMRHYEKDARIGAYQNVIIRANAKKFKEVMEMVSAKALDEVMEELGIKYGYTEKWKAEGQAITEAKVVRNLLKNGFSPKQTAQLSGLDIAKIKEIVAADSL